MEGKNEWGVEADLCCQKLRGVFSQKNRNLREIQLQNNIEQKYKLLDYIQEGPIEQEKLQRRTNIQRNHADNRPMELKQHARVNREPPIP